MSYGGNNQLLTVIAKCSGWPGLELILTEVFLNPINSMILCDSVNISFHSC